jgi:cytochrome c oxidase cbb3-type subunit III
MHRLSSSLIGVPRFLAGLLLIAAVPLAHAAATAEGETIFDRTCAGCHGAGGSGGRGPSLQRQLKHGNQASDIRAVIVNGLPGGMPKFHLDGDELAELVPYVQSLSHGQASDALAKHGGNGAEGLKVYRQSGCASCHKIKAEGSAIGPNLTRVGSSRSYSYLRTSVLDPSADVPEEYQTVTVVTVEGKTVRGLRVNEDSFTIQLRLPDQSFASFNKQSLQKETVESTSFMPVRKFNKQDLDNLLAYLASLTGDADTAHTEEERR